MNKKIEVRNRVEANIIFAMYENYISSNKEMPEFVEQRIDSAVEWMAYDSECEDFYIIPTVEDLELDVEDDKVVSSFSNMIRSYATYIYDMAKIYTKAAVEVVEIATEYVAGTVGVYAKHVAETVGAYTEYAAGVVSAYVVSAAEVVAEIAADAFNTVKESKTVKTTGEYLKKISEVHSDLYNRIKVDIKKKLEILKVEVEEFYTEVKKAAVKGLKDSFTPYKQLYSRIAKKIQCKKFSIERYIYHWIDIIIPDTDYSID